MSELKYKITEEYIEIGDKKLYRIEALKSFRCVEVGEKGGFIESDSNLDQSGDAWISGNAQIYGDAWISGNAQIYGNARIYGNAQISGNARISGYAWISGYAQIYGDAWEKSPLQIQGTSYFINMASKTVLKIGCQEHTISYWLEHYKAIGRANNADEQTINEYYLYIKLAAELYGTNE